MPVVKDATGWQKNRNNSEDPVMDARKQTKKRM